MAVAVNTFTVTWPTDSRDLDTLDFFIWQYITLPERRRLIWISKLISQGSPNTSRGGGKNGINREENENYTGIRLR